MKQRMCVLLLQLGHTYYLFPPDSMNYYYFLFGSGSNHSFIRFRFRWKQSLSLPHPRVLGKRKKLDFEAVFIKKGKISGKNERIHDKKRQDKTRFLVKIHGKMRVKIINFEKKPWPMRSFSYGRKKPSSVGFFLFIVLWGQKKHHSRDTFNDNFRG